MLTCNENFYDMNITTTYVFSIYSPFLYISTRQVFSAAFSITVVSSPSDNLHGYELTFDLSCSFSYFKVLPLVIQLPTKMAMDCRALLYRYTLTARTIFCICRMPAWMHSRTAWSTLTQLLYYQKFWTIARTTWTSSVTGQHCTCSVLDPCLDAAAINRVYLTVHKLLC